MRLCKIIFYWLNSMNTCRGSITGRRVLAAASAEAQTNRKVCRKVVGHSQGVSVDKIDFFSPFPSRGPPSAALNSNKRIVG